MRNTVRSRVFPPVNTNGRSRLDSGFRRISRGFCALFVFITLFYTITITQPAQAQSVAQITPTPVPGTTPIAVPDRVDIEPAARDDQIRTRLLKILEATGWFQNPQVDVQDGVVFLKGQTETKDYKQWAGDLARNTQDVAAVVNQIELQEPSIWDTQPAATGLRDIWVNFIRAIPLLGFSLLVLVVTWIAARLSIKVTRASLGKRLSSPLLNRVIGYAVAVGVFLIGLYIIFEVAGLANVALTVVGGTGILGIVLGIAFRDISENFLASIFLSLQNPFQTGDLVDINGQKGFVQALTTRVTVLMTLDGNHIQIPNATVYKSNILNYTSNPNLRMDFTVGISYGDSIIKAQELALEILEEHPAVLKDPEPWALVENLGNSSVNLRIYFWVDISKHSILKAKSDLIRLVKDAYKKANISIPDPGRERIMLPGLPTPTAEASLKAVPDPAQSGEEQAKEANAKDVAADLSSEAEEIEKLARLARKLDDGENLLKGPDTR